MSMSLMVLFLSEEYHQTIDSGENHGVLSLLCWYLSFSYLSPLHQITVININTDSSSLTPASPRHSFIL